MFSMRLRVQEQSAQHSSMLFSRLVTERIALLHKKKRNALSLMTDVEFACQGID